MVESCLSTWSIAPVSVSEIKSTGEPDAADGLATIEGEVGFVENELELEDDELELEEDELELEDDELELEEDELELEDEQELPSLNLAMTELAACLNFSIAATVVVRSLLSDVRSSMAFCRSLFLFFK